MDILLVRKGDPILDLSAEDFNGQTAFFDGVYIAMSDAAIDKMDRDFPGENWTKMDQFAANSDN